MRYDLPEKSRKALYTGSIALFFLPYNETVLELNVTGMLVKLLFQILGDLLIGVLSLLVLGHVLKLRGQLVDLDDLFQESAFFHLMLAIVEEGLSCLGPALEGLSVLPEEPAEALLPFFIRLLILILLFLLLLSSLSLLLLLLLKLPLPLYELPLILLHLGHALVVLLVLEPREGLPALYTREVPCTTALSLTMFVNL